MRRFNLPLDDEDYTSVERFAAEFIFEEWKAGAKSKLANKARQAGEECHLLANKLKRVPKES
jgi:hypothetical protein